jgi:bloom syndrome protein
MKPTVFHNGDTSFGNIYVSCQSCAGSNKLDSHNSFYSFRLDYGKLGKLKEMFPNVKTMALTASASPSVCDDILKHVGLQEPKWFQTSFNRPNLRYQVRTKPDNKHKALEELVHLVGSSEFKNQSGIIYTFTKRSCDRIHQRLKERGIKVYMYVCKNSIHLYKQIQRFLEVVEILLGWKISR